MPQPSPSTPHLTIEEEKLHDALEGADDGHVFDHDDRELMAAALLELADRRRLGGFYGLKGALATANRAHAQLDKDLDELERDERPPTLADARDNVRREVILLACSGYLSDPGEAAALEAATMALVRLGGLAEEEAIRAGNPERDRLEDVASTARRVILAVRGGGLEREHFTGRLEPVYKALEDLDTALVAAGA